MQVDMNAILSQINAGTNAPVIDLSGQTMTPNQLGDIAAAATATGLYFILKISTPQTLPQNSLTPAHIAALKNSSFNTFLLDGNVGLGGAGTALVAALNPVVCDLSICQATNCAGFATGPLRQITLRQDFTLTAADFTSLMQNPNLRVINVSGDGAHITDAQCLQAAKNHNLTGVDVRGCNASDNTAAFFAMNPNLNSLDLSNCRNLTQTGMQSLAAAPNLYFLTLVGLPASAAKAAQKNLIGINLNFNPSLGDAGFSAYAALPNLRYVAVEACGLTDASIDMMLKMPNLISVDLTGNAVSPAKLAALQAYIQGNLSKLGLTTTNAASHPALMVGMAANAHGKDLEEAQKAFVEEYKVNLGVTFRQKENTLSAAQSQGLHANGLLSSPAHKKQEPHHEHHHAPHH